MIERDLRIASKYPVKLNIQHISTEEGVDPVGSCIGARGMRINNIMKELGGEKIDVIKYSDDAVSFDGHIKYHIKVKGKEKPQTFNSTIYLVKYEDAWRVVNIRSKTQ